MKKRRHHVTDHAVIRYLERVHGVDIDAIRRGISRRVEDGVEQGAIGVRRAGFRFVLVDGVVVTVERIKRRRRRR